MLWCVSWWTLHSSVKMAEIFCVAVESSLLFSFLTRWEFQVRSKRNLFWMVLKWMTGLLLNWYTLLVEFSNLIGGVWYFGDIFDIRYLLASFTYPYITKIICCTTPRMFSIAGYKWALKNPNVKSLKNMWLTDRWVLHVMLQPLFIHCVFK